LNHDCFRERFCVPMKGNYTSFLGTDLLSPSAPTWHTQALALHKQTV